MNKQIYLQFKKEDQDLLFYIRKILDPEILDKVDENLYFISFDDDIEYYSETIKNLSVDFFNDLIAVEVDYMLNNKLLEDVKIVISKFETGVYKLEDILVFVVLGNIESIKKDFRLYYSTRLSQEIINTGLSFIENKNSIKASKALFIHRNTLNYRLETIKKITMLDLKDFKSQLCFYGLFK